MERRKPVEACDETGADVRALPLTQVLRASAGPRQGALAERCRVCPSVLFQSDPAPRVPQRRRGRGASRMDWIGVECLLAIPLDCRQLPHRLDLDHGRRRGGPFGPESARPRHARAAAAHVMGRACEPCGAHRQLLARVLGAAVRPLDRTGSGVPGDVPGRRLLLFRAGLGRTGLDV